MADEVATEDVVAEPTTDETQSEPEVVEEAPATEATIEPTAETESVEAPVEDIPEVTSESPDLSGLTPTQLRELAPELAKQLEYAGEQRREAKLRQEAGTREATLRRVQELKAKLAEAPDAVDADLNFVWDNAAANARNQLMRAFATEAINRFDPDAATRAQLEASAASLEGDALERWTASMVDATANRIGMNRAYELSVDDIPDDTPLKRSIVARERQRLEADRKAREVEAKPKRQPAPSVSSGDSLEDVGDEDPTSSTSAASRAFNQGKIDAARYQQIMKDLGVPIR